MTLGVVAVGAAVMVGGATLGQSGLLTETIAGTATATESPLAGQIATHNATQTPGTDGTATRSTRPATSAEEVGVVDITTVLDYGDGGGRRHRCRAQPRPGRSSPTTT